MWRECIGEGGKETDRGLDMKPFQEAGHHSHDTQRCRHRKMLVLLGSALAGSPASSSLLSNMPRTRSGSEFQIIQSLDYLSTTNPCYPNPKLLRTAQALQKLGASDLQIAKCGSETVATITVTMFLPTWSVHRQRAPPASSHWLVLAGGRS